MGDDDEEEHNCRTSLETTQISITGQPWTSRTCSVPWSSNKAITAFRAHQALQSSPREFPRRDLLRTTSVHGDFIGPIERFSSEDRKDSLVVVGVAAGLIT